MKNRFKTGRAICLLSHLSGIKNRNSKIKNRLVQPSQAKSNQIQPPLPPPGKKNGKETVKFFVFLIGNRIQLPKGF
jgi:hypothetical protein